VPTSTQVQFHGCLPGQGTGFARLSGRKVSALPVLSVAAMVSLANAAVEWARIVMAPVGPRPVRAPEAEQFLVGKTPDTATIAAAGQMAVADAVASAPRSSRPRTVSVLPALVERASLWPWLRPGRNSREIEIVVGVAEFGCQLPVQLLAVSHGYWADSYILTLADTV